MSYIGQTLPADTFQGFTTDSFTGDGSATTFTLSKAPFSENGLIVVINNVIQKPTTNFTVSGTTLTIVGTAVASGDVIYATHLSGVIPSTLASKVDVNGVSDAIILDADADTTISADTDDQIDFKVGGVDEMTMSSSGIVINEGSNDRDFRVESNGKANMLFVDGGNDRVNIGAATSVAATLVVAEGDSGIDSVSANANLLVVEKNDNCGMTILSATDAYASLHFGDSGDADIGQLRYDHTNNSMVFVANAAERMRLDSSGHLNIGFASFSSTDTGLKLYADGQIYFVMNSSSSTNVQRFYNSSSGNIAGSINMNGDATAFNTSSDYRLKENVVDLENATDRLKQLKVKRFNFKSDTDTTLDGFLAHEVSSIVPEAITGEKDAVDDNDKIIPQGIDQSKLVPLMVKTIQELEARIKVLEDA